MEDAKTCNEINALSAIFKLCQSTLCHINRLNRFLLPPHSFPTIASEPIVSGFNLRRNMSGESWWSCVFLLRGSLDATLIKSCAMLLARGSTVDSPWRIKADFPFGRSHSCEGPSRRRCWVNVPSLSLIPCLLLFDAGHVSVVPRLIYHSNCEWRTGTAEGTEEGCSDPPPRSLYT